MTANRKASSHSNEEISMLRIANGGLVQKKLWLIVSRRYICDRTHLQTPIYMVADRRRNESSDDSLGETRIWYLLASTLANEVGKEARKSIDGSSHSVLLQINTSPAGKTRLDSPIS